LPHAFAFANVNNPPYWRPSLVPWPGLSAPAKCNAAGAQLALFVASQQGQTAGLVGGAKPSQPAAHVNTDDVYCLHEYKPVM